MARQPRSTKLASFRSAKRLRDEAAQLRRAAHILKPGPDRVLLAYAALYAETSAYRRDAAEGFLGAAADEIIARYRPS
jgi:hypothetical protein